MSLDDDRGGSLRNKLAKEALRPNGFENSPGGFGTGIWINDNCRLEQMAECMKSFWSIVEGHDGPGKVDHVLSSFEPIEVRHFVNSMMDPDKQDKELAAFLKEIGLKEPK